MSPAPYPQSFTPNGYALKLAAFMKSTYQLESEWLAQ